MTPRELLKSGASELGIVLSDEQINSFFVYFAELKKWNRQINLTAITDEREIVIKHALDSLSYIYGFSPSAGIKLLDMGSGAGFPALPLKILYPEISICMAEAVSKKASFLRHMLRTLKMQNSNVWDKRVEAMPSSFHASFDIVTARAFADMESALSAGTPFLKDGGLAVLSRGPEETIDAPILEKLRLVVYKKNALTLPHSDYKRVIWVFQKQ